MLVEPVEDVSQLHHVGETAVHTFDRDDEGMPAKEDEGVVGQCGRGATHCGVAAHSCEELVVGRGEFALRRDNDELGIEGGVETSDEIAKTIEHAERAHHGSCRHYNASHSNGRDEVDGVVTLLGEEIAESNDVGE